MVLIPNRIREAAAARRSALGIYVTQPAPAIVEIAGAAGLDFVRIDAYHGTLTSEAIGQLIRAGYASNVCPTVRVTNDPIQILAALEQGAMGITVPEVDSADVARAVVDATRYPPRGHRPISRPARLMGEPADAYFRWAEAELLVSVQIETAEGLARVDEIAMVDGVDMIQSGRNDLALSLGVPGQPNHPRVLEAEARIVEAAARAGKWVSLHFHPGPDALQRARAWIRQGVQCITLGNDLQILHGALVGRAGMLGDTSE